MGVICRLINRSVNTFGALTLFGFIRYCFRSPHLARKMGLGLMLFYWKRHIFQLGSYAGIFYALKTNINQLCTINDERTSKKVLQHFLPKLKSKAQHLTKNDFYDFVFKPGGKAPFQNPTDSTNNPKEKTSSYSTNDYFAVNRHKYFSEDSMDRDTIYLNRESLKLKYFDSFLTRYVYYGFARWWRGSTRGVSNSG